MLAGGSGVSQSRSAVWIKQVQWMPMIGGILKKIRQSGQVKFITARVVYESDDFDFWIDETGEHLTHRPAWKDRGNVHLVYAMATTNDGTLYVEVLTVEDVEKIRNSAKSANSPAWRNWWNGMAEAKVLRKLSKRLPLSNELMTVIQRDDEAHEFESMRDVSPQRKQHQSAHEMLADNRQEVDEDPFTLQMQEENAQQQELTDENA
jgi:recombination protein RecT